VVCGIFIAELSTPNDTVYDQELLGMSIYEQSVSAEKKHYYSSSQAVVAVPKLLKPSSDRCVWVIQ